jgi:hypothetical protein
MSKAQAMQLDPGFTWGSFGANVAVEFVSAFFGMLGALFVALLIYRKTRDDQQAIFKEQAENVARAREEEELRQRAAIRAALHYEVTDNLRRLEQFWSRIVLAGSDKNSPEAIARRLVDMAVPSWSVGVWQGASATVAVAISRQQLDETYRLYTTLAEISEVQRRLQLARDSDTAAYAAEPETPAVLPGIPGHKWQTTNYFGGVAARHVSGLLTDVQLLLDHENPIPPEPIPDGPLPATP